MQSKDNKLKSGILLAISSLPSNYGIGCFDRAAYRFIDFLAECNQSFWQILPLCPIGKGNSPYYSPASFGGEMLYIDIEKLKEDGLIDTIPQHPFSKNVDYKSVKKFKTPIIFKAAENFNTNSKDYKSFCKENSYWLEIYAEFMVLRDYYGDSPFTQWEDGYKYKLPKEINLFKEENYFKIETYKIIQYFFYSQYTELKSYANKKGIKIIGDIPFYVSPDSADVWGEPQCFKLNRDMTPSLVAGVPPDIFSKTGQLWGNPIYDWDYQKQNGYLWWQKRLSHNSRLYDIIRIDHFRAFSDYYAIPSGSENAKNGNWVLGEGMNFWETVKPSIEETKIIAEDLGGETPEVQSLIVETGFPNMKVLQFAFDSDISDPFLPRNFGSNCVCYTGTHDNDTTLGWYKNATRKEKILFECLTADIEEHSPVFKLISYGMQSIAEMVIIPLQDYLELDSPHRLNTPGTDSGNWEWRFKDSDLTEKLKNDILRLSKGRN